MQGKIKKLLLAFLTATACQSSHAIDLQPFDIVAPKSGFSSAQLSYQYSERKDFYSHGKVTTGLPAINSSIYALRVGRSFELAQLPAYFYVQLPFGSIHPQGLSSDSGLGDTSMALAVWPYASRETQTYFGIAAYLTLPTGSYDANRAFSLGENRYKTALQVGYEMPLASRLAGMAVFDAVWFGDNTDAPLPYKAQKLEQDTLYTAQLGLRYDFNPQYSLAGNYYYVVGGETSYNGVDQGNITQLQRFQVSGVGTYSFGRITVQYGRDLKTENGYFEDNRLTLRYTMLF